MDAEWHGQKLENHMIVCWLRSIEQHDLADRIEAREHDSE